METGGAPSKGDGFLSRMALNDHKAGMEGLDRDKINKIIMESSKGSRFYENELKKEKQVNQRIEKMMLQKAQFTEQQLRKAQTQVERMASELDNSRDLSRVIVHVDMDAFYAAVEMRDCPEFKDKPIAVGSMSMLSTSNYHARKFGVRAAMPGFIAKKLCPNLVIVPTNFDKYRAVSAEIREIFAEYDPHFLPLSLDEAYLDFTDHLEQRISWPESVRTHCFRNNTTEAGSTGEVHQEPGACVEDLSPVLFEDSPNNSTCLSTSGEVGGAGGGFEVFGTCTEEAVREMRFRIEQKTMLTASAGIAPNMMLAKVCSDKNKPNGQYRLPSNREAVMDFIQKLPVRKVCGIGKVSEKMLGALGITSCAHLGQQMALLSLLFSETAWHHFMSISLGLGSTYIERDGERKSISIERTFKEMSRAEEQLSLCRELCEDLAADMKKEGLRGKTVTLKLKNVNFEVKTRAVTPPCSVATSEEVFAVAKDLLNAEIEHVIPQPLRLRLMGVRISAFVSSDEKKPLQKSIVGFLQQGSAGSTGGVAQKPGKEVVLDDSVQVDLPVRLPSLQPVPPKAQRQEGLPWKSGQAGSVVGASGEKRQTSFFQRAHAKKLQLQAERVDGPEEEHGGDSSERTHVEGTDNRKRTDSLTEMHESKRGFLGSGRKSAISNVANVTGSPLDARASTSGSAATIYESLTCPVCFREVRMTDLNVFNGHIDRCLSGVASKPYENTDGDLESDEGTGQKEWMAKDNWIKEEEREETKPGEDLSGFKMSQPQPGINQLDIDTNQGTLEGCRGDGLGHHSRNIHPSQRDSSLHGGTPVTVTSELQSHRSHEGSTLICPVCQVTQNTDDLTEFNRHVDLCLNQEVILKLGEKASSSVRQPPIKERKSKSEDQHLQRQANKGKSKRRGPPSSPHAKKAKALGSQNTIDRFFR